MFLGHGFQAFLSKPIDILKLDAAIRRWIKNKNKLKDSANDGRVLATSSGTVATGSMEERLMRLEPTFDLSACGFSVKEGLARFGDDSEILLDILQSYASNAPALLEKLLASEAERDLEAYAVTIHGIKGSSQGICATQIGDEAWGLEKAAKAGDAGFIHSQNERFIRKVRDFLDALNKFLAAARGGSKNPHVDAPTPAFLAQSGRQSPRA
jgi:HPt (histidine-containing phosphotransfer) domain-containing protein